MSKIVLVRHGETDYNKQLIIQGRLDIPLNELGRMQASKTANHFKDNCFDVIISSPLVRAHETAQIIAREINYTKEILINQSFIERNFGFADGKNVMDFIDLVHENKVDGLEGEEELKKRMLNGILEVCDENKNILIVCHSHSIKAVLAALDPANYDFKTRLINCSLTELEYKDNQLTIIQPSYNAYL